MGKITNSILSTSPDSWFSVNPEDYLQRGYYELDLRQKLDLYLRSQDLNPKDFPFAYLVTAPRFLGFSFNPVSFWYLYNTELSAMILEVNNTFDERRMYLLNKQVDGTFKQEWKKDFHVSPFNDRQGSYSLVAQDPRTSIDNTITLMEDGKPKIIARIHSTGNGIDPDKITTSQLGIFILQWSWVGFLTNVRILREARNLWMKNLQVFYRPEPLKTNIGRTPTPQEIVIQRTFLQVLEKLGSKAHLCINYISAAGPNIGQNIKIGRGSEITLQVGTPSFYSNLVLASSLNDFFRVRLDDSQTTFWISDAESLLSATGMGNSSLRKRGIWNLISGLLGLQIDHQISEYEALAKGFIDEKDWKDLREASRMTRIVSQYAFGSVGLWHVYVVAFRWIIISVIVFILK